MRGKFWGVRRSAIAGTMTQRTQAPFQHRQFVAALRRRYQYQQGQRQAGAAVKAEPLRCSTFGYTRWRRCQTAAVPVVAAMSTVELHQNDEIGPGTAPSGGARLVVRGCRVEHWPGISGSHV